MTKPESEQSGADSTTQVDEVTQEWQSSPLTEPELAVDHQARRLQDGPAGDSHEAERIAQRPDF